MEAKIIFGSVSEVLAASHRVRVSFPALGIVSAPLPVVVPGTGGTKYFRLPAVGDQVACVMDCNLEDGVVVGALYSDAATPASPAATKTRVIFADGAQVQYDTATQVLAVEVATSTLSVGATGIKIQRGAETLKAVLLELLTQLSLETHVSAAPGSPTSPPVNASAYTALITRLNTLLL